MKKVSLLVVMMFLVLFTGCSLTPPKTPQNLVAKPIEKGIELYWDGVNGAKEYKVYSSKSESGEYTEIGNTNSNNYKITDLDAETIYFFKVNAKNNLGSSDDSEVVSASPKLEKPKNLKYEFKGYSLKLTWDSVENVTTYQILKSEGDNKNYSLLNTTEKNYFTITNIVNGKNYSFVVKSKNTLGVSDASNKIFITVKLPPTPPQNFTVSSGNSTALLTWDNVEKADFYNIYQKDAEGAETLVAGNIEKNEYTVEGLQNKTKYYFAVSSSNSNGEGDKTEYKLITPYNPDEKPDATTISVSKSNDSIKISWNKVIGATSYKIYYSTTQGGTYHKLKETTNLYYYDSYFDYDTTYYYVVKSINKAGESEYSNEDYITIHKLQPPLVPTNFTAYIDHPSGDVILTWDASYTAKYYKLYKIKYYDTPYQEITVVNSSIYTTSYNLGYLDSGEYIYALSAVNDAGTSEQYSIYGFTVTRR
ncbi:fibronectin type III domain-containing protein [Haliovirga abyssi]|uniref:Fibronectin type-III domain-containing protein n=1 Tax=Haliovirga abyssi TaxID=2996794 RepID=A0AAU9DGN1_9FUSO|nr:fibronectin type III domain-containing protein [Haliovirga abyssi]BDU51428.1 hypothetical protein HLVA_19970 [Haliovirga abyssi]